MIPGPHFTIVLSFCLVASFGSINCVQSQDSFELNNHIGRSDSAEVINTIKRYFRHNANQDGDSLVQVVDCRKFMLSRYPEIESGHTDTVDCAVFISFQEKMWRIGSAIGKAKGQSPLSPADTSSAETSLVWPSSLTIESINPRSSTVAVDSAMVISLQRNGAGVWKVVSYRTRN